MNPKQFVNNGICYIIDSLKGSTLLKWISLLMYPDYPLLPKIKLIERKNLFQEIIRLYIFSFIILFIIPVIWSYLNGRLWVDEDDITTNLFEDKANLWNYLIICELYIIIGYYILKTNSNLKDHLRKSNFTSLIKLDGFDEKTKSKFGYFGLVILFVSTLYFASGYAHDITLKSTSHYWFMETFTPNVTYSRLGYYYFFINFLLLFFVLIVGFSYFGFINKIGFIANQMKLINRSYDVASLKKQWEDDNILKQKLSPITTQMLLLQLMVAILTLNIVLWNINKQGLGFNYDVTVFILIIFGVWLFTLPRYYINYQVFKIWQKIGKNEYKNLSLPWLMGLSSVIDIVLFSLLLNKLLDKELSEIIKNIIG